MVPTSLDHRKKSYSLRHSDPVWFFKFAIRNPKSEISPCLPISLSPCPIPVPLSAHKKPHLCKYPFSALSRPCVGFKSEIRNPQSMIKHPHYPYTRPGERIYEFVLLYGLWRIRVEIEHYVSCCFSELSFVVQEK